MRFLFLIIIVLSAFNLNAQKFKFDETIGKYRVKILEGEKKQTIYVDEYFKRMSGRSKIRIDEGWGLIDKNREILLEPKYQLIKEYWRGRAIVKINDKYGVVDLSGEYLLEPIYDRIDYSYEYESLVQIGEQWGTVVDGIFKERSAPGWYVNPDTKPILVECVGEDEGCTTRELLERTYRNLNYPWQYIEAGIEGTLLTQLIVDESGKLMQVDLLNSLGKPMDKQVKNLLTEQFPEWIPGKQGDEVVKSKIVFPIRFKIGR